MPKPIPLQFHFSSYEFKPKQKLVRFSYEVTFRNQEPLRFTEELLLPRVPTLKHVPRKMLENVLESMHLMLGISYYKLHCGGKVHVPYQLTKSQADFWTTVYRKGLGEFFFQNELDPKKHAPVFKASNKKEVHRFDVKQKDRSLVGIGGGKDSVVVAELMKAHQKSFKSFVVQTGAQAEAMKQTVKEIGAGSVVVKRQIDPLLFEKHPGSYNGHIPISAVIAFVSYFTALLYDYSSVVVGNEHSSSFGNIAYCGEEVNHQWSKSLEFEELFDAYVKESFGTGIAYFSLLRPFTELRIAKMFAQHKQYFSKFTSCNRHFRVHRAKETYRWCGECPKCAFVFLMLAAFLPKKELVGFFHKNLLDDEKLLPLYKDLLGFGDMKPFECVGTFEESRAALVLASKRFKSSVVVRRYLQKIRKPDQLIKEVFATHEAPVMPTSFKLMGMKKVLILGYGKEGQETKRYLKARYPELKIGIADRSRDQNYLHTQEGFDLAIKTPGIHKSHVTIPYTTATNLFFSDVQGNAVVGITGTKGKSTTASLIHAMLKEAGLPVKLLGNIGVPMLSALVGNSSKKTIYIVELSSYQLDDIDFSPDVSVVTNLFPEHLDYHGSQEEYYKAKHNILLHQTSDDVFIYQPKDAALAGWAKTARGKAVPFVQDIPLKDADIPLLGEHNRENIKAAMTVAKQFKVSDAAIKRAVKGFKGLPHRLQLVGTHRGVTFYDDAIATTPEATIEALRSLEGVETILLGGKDRGYDFTKLEKELRKRGVKHVVLFPNSGKKILKSKKGFDHVMLTESMRSAVQFAYKHTGEGKICLLSCASPSYSLWKNFEEKGDQFQKEVKRQGGK